MSFIYKPANEFETVYKLLNFNTNSLTSATVTTNIFTSDANKGYCMVTANCIYLKSITAGSPTQNFSPRIGVPSSLTAIAGALAVTTSAGKGYQLSLTFPHSIPPSTAVVFSNGNANVGRFDGIIHIYLKVVYFGT